MRRLSFAVLCAVLLLPSLAIAANRYRVTVTRQDSNLYKVDGTSYWIRTRHCYEYSYGDRAIIVWNGKGSYSNSLIFVDYEGNKKSSCDLEAMFVEAEPQ